MHPGGGHADAASVGWMRRFALCGNEAERDRLSQTGCGKLVARIVPHASQQTLQILSDFFVWNVAFDDEYCDEGPLSRRPGDLARVLSLIQRSIEIPELALNTQDRYAAALHDIRQRLDAHATAAQMSQWVAAMRGWFLAEVWKAGNVAAQRMPTLDEYVTLRLYSGGGLVFPVLATIAEGYAVPADVLEARRVRALTEMAASLATWAADIASYEKEIAREEGGHNLISVIQHERRCGPAGAGALAASMYRQVMQLFLRSREALAPDGSPALRRYLDSLGHYLRAAFDWCHASERYPQAGGPEATLTAAAEAPLQASSIASVAWWWMHDPAGATAQDTAAQHTPARTGVPA